MKPEAPVEREVRVLPVRSPSPPPPRRRGPSRHDDDDEWIEASPRKRARNARPPTPPALAGPALTAPALVAPAPVAPVVALAATPTPVAAVPTSPAPAAPTAAPATPATRPASAHSRLLLLFKYKEMLKKDIIKKRGLLEKELGVEIQVGTQRILV